MTKQKLFTLLGALALVASLAGCSLLPSKENIAGELVSKLDADPVKETVETTVDVDKKENEEETEVEEEIEVEEESETSEEKKGAEYKDLEEYFSNPLNKAGLEAMANSSEYENIFSNVEVEIEGNRMIYKFTSVNELPDNIEETMQTNANNAKGQLFANIRSMVDTESKMEIEYIYFNPDGTQVADIILYEDDGDQTTGYETDAEEGTLQYYYESTYGSEYWNSSAETLLAQYSDTVSDVKIECIGNTVSYYFYFNYDLGDAQEALESTYDEASKKSVIDQVKVPTGVKDTVTVEYYYFNPDGSTAAKIVIEG